MSGSNSSNPAAAGSTGAEAVPLTVHAMPGLDMSQVDAQRRTRMGRWQLILVVLACAAPVIASYFTYYLIRPAGRSNYATLIEPSRPMPPDLQLTQLDGKAVSPASLKGQWLLLVVGPSTCDDACQTRLYAQRQLREVTGRERDRIDKIWLITDVGPLEPKLKAALEAAPPALLLRADGQAVSRWLQPAPGESLGSHLYVVDPYGQWMMRAPADLQPSKFKRDLERLLRASAFWDKAGRGPNGEPAP
jgi:SCO1/SenC